jgi:hypothetical protein
MTRKKVFRHAPCPCGSDKKHNPCCYGKQFDWTEDEEGSVSREIPVSDELMDVLAMLRQEFVSRHGREPTSNPLSKCTTRTSNQRQIGQPIVT